MRESSPRLHSGIHSFYTNWVLFIITLLYPGNITLGSGESETRKPNNYSECVGLYLLQVKIQTADMH